MNKINGAYSLVIMSPAKLIAARDENGFRPLCYGITNEGTYIVASESCALDSVGAKFVRDLLPGEIVVLDENGVRSIKDHCGKRPHTLCVFEYIYFARPDSVIEGASVHEARLRAGAFLALEHPVQADIVIGVPDSGIQCRHRLFSPVGYPLRHRLHQEQIHRQDLYLSRSIVKRRQGAYKAERCCQRRKRQTCRSYR